MDKDLKEKWLEALRSGKYTQGKRFLKQETSDGDIKYCCLGVLAECYDPEFFIRCIDPEFYDSSFKNENIKVFVGKDNQSSVSYFTKTREKIGLNDYDMIDLMRMNDIKSKDFNYIADWIEENL